MARGATRLSRVQFTAEATSGTSTSGSIIWRGKASFHEDKREVTNVEEDVGYIGGTDRSYIAKAWGELKLEETELTYEQAQYLFMGMGWGNGAGSAQGTGGASGTTYVFTNTVPTTAQGAGTSFTFFTGNNAEALTSNFNLCQKVSIKGEGGGALMVASEWMGRDVGRAAGGTFITGVLESVEEVLFGQGTFYLNSTGTAYGATQVSNQLLSLEMNIEVQWTPKYTEGATVPAYFVYGGHTIEGNLTFEHDSTGSIVAGATSQLHTQWKGGTAQHARLQWTGGSIPTGTTFTNKTFRMDFPLKWKNFEPLDDMDGNAVMTGNFFSKYNTTGANAGTFLVARNGALP